MTATIVPYDNVGMSAIHRCSRCGAQAYVEVTFEFSDEPMLFCAHHAREHWPKLVEQAATIADHRPFLAAQEKEPVPAK